MITTILEIFKALNYLKKLKMWIKKEWCYKRKSTSLILYIEKYWALYVIYIMQGYYKKYGKKNKNLI